MPYVMGRCFVFLLVAVLVGAVQAQPLQPGSEIVVDGKNGSLSEDCWRKELATCWNLNSALEGAQVASEPLSIVIHPGVYQLNTNFTAFTNANYLTLSGSSDGVTVNCNQSSGLAFSQSQHIVIENITFIGCRLDQSLEEENLITEFSAALSFHYCANISLRSIQVIESDGIGVFFHNTLGMSSIKDSKFTNNSCLEDLYPAGGVVIVLNFCSLDSETACSKQDTEGIYIRNCTFESNAAEVSNGFGVNGTSAYNKTSLESQGGGLAIYLLGNTTSVNISIVSCNFTRNYAQEGGGLYTLFSGTAQHNFLTVEDSLFDSNNHINGNQLPPQASHGGGAHVAQMHEVALPNSVKFTSCRFESNMALVGGGFAVKSTFSMQTMKLTDCDFVNNFGNLGAALYFSDQQEGGKGHSHQIENCSFYRNIVQHSSSKPGLIPRVGLGAVYVYRVRLNFFRNITFSANKGSALAVVGSTVSILCNTNMVFVNNTGVEGGAISIFNNGLMKIYPKTVLIFDQNSAEQYGGAVFHKAGNIYNFVSARHCFVTYSNDSVHPNDWNTSIIFSGNTARNKHNSIWSTSLDQCSWKTQVTDISDVFCWRPWEYQGSNCSDQILSAASRIVQKSDNYVYPGLVTRLPVTFLDDLSHDITDSVLLTVSVGNDESGAVRYDDLHINADSRISIFGVPNTTLTLKLQTPGLTGLSQDIQVQMLPCPPGFIPQPYDLPHSDQSPSSTPRCVCASNNDEHITCNDNGNGNFNATLKSGSGMSYDEEQGTVLVGATPYCLFGNLSITLPHNVSELDEFLCGDFQRTGILCGKCKEGYSYPIDLEDNRCTNCTTSLFYAWLYASFGFLLPTTILYFVITLFDINAASAGLNGYIFYSQVASFPLRNRIVQMWFSAIPFSNSLMEFLSAYPYFTIPYTMWNLNFQIFKIFHQDTMCLLRGSSIMAHIALGYIIAIYPLFFVAVNYLLVELYAHNFKPVVWLWKPFRVCFLRFKRTWNPRHCMINAFATFIIISYVKFLTTSIDLLSFTTLWDTYNQKSRQVFYYDASVTWFGREHLPYALLAIAVLCIFVLSPPIILLLYPLKTFQKFMNKCTCVKWQAFKAFVDTFQGCFKDGTEHTRDYRYFAGLYLIFRILLIAIYAWVPHIYMKYLALNMFYVFVLPLFALLRPYRQDVYNYLDTAIFGILSLIAILEFFNYHTVLVNQTWIFTACLPFVLFYIPLVCALLYSIYWMICKLGKRCCPNRKPQYRSVSESAGFPDRILNPSRYNKLLDPSFYDINSSDGSSGKKLVQEEQEVPVNSTASTSVGNKYGSLAEHHDGSENADVDELICRSTELQVLSSDKC